MMNHIYLSHMASAGPFSVAGIGVCRTDYWRLPDLFSIDDLRKRLADAEKPSRREVRQSLLQSSICIDKGLRAAARLLLRKSLGQTGGPTERSADGSMREKSSGAAKRGVGQIFGLVGTIAVIIEFVMTALSSTLAKVGRPAAAESPHDRLFRRTSGDAQAIGDRPF